MPTWLKKLDQLDFQINALCGKANSKKKQKKLYNKLLPIAEKAKDHLYRQLEKVRSLTPEA